MTGRRIADGELHWGDYPNGAYGREKFGSRTRWVVRTPTGLTGLLTQHQVTEHDDGTITVHSSILVNTSDGRSWHGWLERGVWREV